MYLKMVWVSIFNTQLIQPFALIQAMGQGKQVVLY